MVQWIPAVIAQIKAGEATRGGYTSAHLPNLEADLKHARAYLRKHPLEKCQPHSEPEARKRISPQCGHGMLWCPARGAMDGSAKPCVDAATAFSTTIMRIRAALTAASETRALVPVKKDRNATMGDPPNVVRWGRLHVETPRAGGIGLPAQRGWSKDEVRIVFEDEAPGEPGRHCLSIAMQEGSFTENVSAAQFEWLVDHLVAVHDRTRAEGFI